MKSQPWSNQIKADERLPIKLIRLITLPIALEIGNGTNSNYSQMISEKSRNQFTFYYLLLVL